MERILSKLFDFQKFQDNPRISEMIRDTENRYGKELADTDLLSVNAAGEAEPSEHMPERKKNDDPDI